MSVFFSWERTILTGDFFPNDSKLPFSASFFYSCLELYVCLAKAMFASCSAFFSGLVFQLLIFVDMVVLINNSKQSLLSPCTRERLMTARSAETLWILCQTLSTLQLS